MNDGYEQDDKDIVVTNNEYNPSVLTAEEIYDILECNKLNEK